MSAAEVIIIGLMLLLVVLGMAGLDRMKVIIELMPQKEDRK